MHNRGLLIRSVYVVVFTAIASTSSFAEHRSTNGGVYTESQATAGKKVYETHCKFCHDDKFYAGVLQSWAGQPVSVLFETILATMPENNPGILFEDEVANVMAFIFSSYGYPAGDLALGQTSDALADIVIEKLTR